jgi:O-antigen/teichoic acid export membrane protein
VTTRSGRALWSLVDQVLSSGTNIALGLVIARLVSAREFGAYSLAFVAYTVILGLCSAGISDPVVVRHSSFGAGRRSTTWGAATGAAIVFGLLTGLPVALAGFVVGGPLGRCLLAVGLLLPGLLAQDVIRYVFFAEGSPRGASGIDAVWAATQLTAYVGVAAGMAAPGPEHLLAAWGLSAWVAALVGLVRLRVRPTLGAGRQWWMEHRDLGRPFAGDFAMRTGASQLAMAGAGAVAGLQALGALRAGLLLMGPVNLAASGLRIFALPEGSRIRDRSPGKLLPASVVLATVIVAGGALWSVVLLAIPDSVGIELLGDTWSGARELLPFVAVLTLGGVSAAPALYGLRILGAGRRLLRARGIDAVLTTVAAVGGAAAYGARGAALGWAAANVVVSVVWWVQFRRASLEYPKEHGTKRPPSR